MRSTCLILVLSLFTVSLAGAALSPQEIQKLPYAKVEAALPQNHPSCYLQYSARLFHEGKKEDSVFWFYVGSIRYRFHLAANPKSDPSGDLALFSSLQSVLGTQVNEYAGGDAKAWLAQIDRALQWDNANENGFTSKKTFAKELVQVREGLGKLKSWIETNREQIKKQRKQNGLPTKD